jgi:hypothetical protein
MRRLSAWLPAALSVVLVGCGGGSTSSSQHATGPTTTSASSSTSTSAASSSTTSTAAAAKPPRHQHHRSNSNPHKAIGALSPSSVTEAVLKGRPTTIVCGDLVTARFLKKAYGGAQGCKAALGSGGVANSVRVEKVQPEGRFALVMAVPKGGPSNGERLAVSLVRDAGVWQVEAIHSNAKVGP